MLKKIKNWHVFGMIHETIFSYVYKDNNLYGYGY